MCQPEGSGIGSIRAIRKSAFDTTPRLRYFVPTRVSHPRRPHWQSLPGR